MGDAVLLPEGETFTVIVPARGKGFGQVMNDAIEAIYGRTGDRPVEIVRIVAVPGNPEVTEYKITFAL